MQTPGREAEQGSSVHCTINSSIEPTPLGVKWFAPSQKGGCLMDATCESQPQGDDGEWVYCRSFRHWRTGKIVYPKKGTFFRFRRKR